MRTNFPHQQLQLQRNFSCSVYLLGYFLYEVSASAYEMSEQRVCGGGGGGGLQRITVTLRGRDWAARVFFGGERVCLCCSTLSQY